jgi:hypothetical protein
MEMKAHNIERLRNKNKESARQLTQRAESIRKNLQVSPSCRFFSSSLN